MGNFQQSLWEGEGKNQRQRYPLKCDLLTVTKFDVDSQMFRGNWDEMTVHKNMFERRIRARFVRFNPRTWRLLGQICMRVEIYLCRVYQGTFFIKSNPVPTLV